MAVIPMRRNRKDWRAVDRDFYRWRNLVEHCFSKLKQWRRAATRYDKTALSFLGFIDIASVRVWLRFCQHDLGHCQFVVRFRRTAA